MKALLVTSIFFLTNLSIMAQPNTDLPFREIPEYPETYNAGSVMARMIDGLGFRYYWATEGLREEDLNYKPNEEARTSLETIDHIYGLTEVIVNAVLKKPTIRPTTNPGNFEELRTKTLENLKEARDILINSSDKDLGSYMIVFERAGNKSEFPFWNNINGPIADAMWHVGQIVSFRRSSGNPFNSKVSVFTGKVRN